MLLTPVIVGSVISDIDWGHALLTVSWVTAYLGFMAVKGCSRQRGGRRYRVPAAIYCGVGIISVALLLVWRPGLAWWAVPLGVLGASSLLLIKTRRERSVVNDAVMIGASCLMAVVATSAPKLTTVEWSLFLSVVTTPRPWLVFSVLAAYFWGTILYVKTMIRERGKRGWYVASVAYHLVTFAAAMLINPWVAAVGAIASARAIVIPLAWPRAKPKVIGMIEMLITVTLAIVVCLTMR